MTPRTYNWYFSITKSIFSFSCLLYNVNENVDVWMMWIKLFIIVRMERFWIIVDSFTVRSRRCFPKRRWITRNIKHICIKYIISKSSTFFIRMSSTKQSSISSTGRNGSPKNCDNHLPISQDLSLYSELSPTVWIFRHQLCARWKRQQSILQAGNTLIKTLIMKILLQNFYNYPLQIMVIYHYQVTLKIVQMKYNFFRANEKNDFLKIRTNTICPLQL